MPTIGIDMIPENPSVVYEKLYRTWQDTRSPVPSKLAMIEILS